MSTVYDDPFTQQYPVDTSGRGVFSINGYAGDYGWAVAEDGEGVVVWNGDQFDVLHGFSTIQFHDATVTVDPAGEFSVAPLTPAEGREIADRPGMIDFATGTSSDADRFVISGAVSEFRWSVAEDGIGIVVWRGADYNVLHDIEQMVFDDAIVSLNGSTFTLEWISEPPGQTYIDQAGVNENLGGTFAIDDVFVIDAPSSTYQWGMADDGVGVVLWNGAEYSVLHDIEMVQFTDGVLNIGGGQFSFEQNPDAVDWQALSEAKIAEIGAVAVGDINGDAYDDFILSEATGPTSILWGGSDGIRNYIEDGITTEITDFRWNTQLIGSGDFNGDGLMDPVFIENAMFRNETGFYVDHSTTYVLYGAGDIMPGEDIAAQDLNGNVGSTTPMWAGAAAILGDINGDGYDDLFLPGASDDKNGAATRYHIALGGENGVGSGGELVLPDVYTFQSLGDLDADGVTDFQVEGSNAIVYGKAEGFGSLQLPDGYDFPSDLAVLNNPVSQGLFPIDPATLDAGDAFVALGQDSVAQETTRAFDINGDGANDLLFNNSGNASAYVLYSAGSYTGEVNLPDLGAAQALQIDRSGVTSDIVVSRNPSGEATMQFTTWEDTASQVYFVTGNVNGLSPFAGDFSHLVIGSQADNTLTGHDGADMFIATNGNDTISNMLFDEGDVLNLDALLPDSISSETIGDYVSVAQNGADAVVSVTVGSSTLASITLDSVDLSSFNSINELVDSGYLSY